jgi:UDP-GlcNAc:undecaprenyl-phosphate/decaprenyl-phosphate GlcNAc-1-phosphate transferase
MEMRGLAMPPYAVLGIRYTVYVILDTVTMSAIVIVPLSAFALCVALHVIALRAFPALGLLDFPQRYGLARARLPYPTGILAVSTFLVVYLLFEPVTLRSAGIVVAILLLAGVSFLDDRRSLPPLLRLIVQMIAALTIFLTGTRIYSITNPLEQITGIPYLPLDVWQVPLPALGNPSIAGAVFTVLWLGLTMNALNWFDGIRGQVSVLSVIGFLTIGALSMSSRVGDVSLATIAFTLAGIAAAGLLFDFPPGKVLMGDTGAMFFGLMLGVLTIYAGGKVATGFLVLGVPLLDCVIVVLRRITKGASPLRGNASNEHLHHRLLRRGWSEQHVIALNAALGTAFGALALFMDTLQKFLAALALAGIMVLLSVYSGRNVERGMPWQ